MTAERWAQITSVFRAALEKPAGDRAAYLEKTCSGDEALRRSVERLLAGEAEPIQAGQVPEFLEGGAMELASGETLAQYRVEAKIGEGGMGAVYRAFDTRLQRKVALKVLSPEHFANPDRRRRLIEEARAASGLNHPNIITIYEIGLDRGVDFIAMEYVEGKRLDELIPSKGLRATQLLRYAAQVADGLAKAHGAGILHRDLKPSNMMVTEEGRLKILDFGLAKVLEAVPASPDAPTATMRAMTEEGTVAGTAAYMSPEQAEGRKLDVRSDIFSFGSVLYEMATGQRPFAAESRLALLTKIVNEDPRPPSQMSPLPRDLEKLILRCLRKDAARRYQTMADLKVALEDLQTETSLPPLAQTPNASVSRRMRMAALLAAVATLVVIAVLGMRAFRNPAEAGSGRTVKFTITPADLSKGSTHDVDTAVFLSPDGRHIAYIESRGGQLWVRDMDQEQAHPVPGATGAYEAFWSPDNQFIGYSTGFACPDRGGCDLMKIAAQGGTPVVVTKLHGSFKRAAWSSDGETIVFADNGGLYTIPARGGTPTRVLDHPHIEHPSILDLPGRKRAFLFQAMDPDRPGGHGIYIQVPGEDRRRFLAMSSSTNPYPAYSPTGHIIYTDGTFESAAVWALPFSLSTLQATGKAFPVAQHGASPRVSRTGTLVYSDVPSNHMQLVWCDRSGKTLSTIGEPIRQENLALSPDGRRLAVENRESAPDIWVYDLERGIKTRFTFDSAGHAINGWTRSGDEITYSAFRDGNFDIFSKPANGSGEPKLLVSTPQDEMFADWSPDQKFLIYAATVRGDKGQLLYRERRPDGSLGDAVVFRKTDFNQRFPRFSPDGRFVAYVSDESGKDQVYVRDFPNGASQWQISANGGTAPRWSRDGKEIFYVDRGGLVSVSVTPRPAFSVGTAALLFGKRQLQGGYDVSPDGRRFVVLEKPAGEPPLAIHVVHNWFEEFRGQRGQPAP